MNEWVDFGARKLRSNSLGAKSDPFPYFAPIFTPVMYFELECLNCKHWGTEACRLTVAINSSIDASQWTLGLYAHCPMLKNARTHTFSPNIQNRGPMHFQLKYTWLNFWHIITQQLCDRGTVCDIGDCFNGPPIANYTVTKDVLWSQMVKVMTIKSMRLNISKLLVRVGSNWPFIAKHILQVKWSHLTSDVTWPQQATV